MTLSQTKSRSVLPQKMSQYFPRISRGEKKKLDDIGMHLLSFVGALWSVAASTSIRLARPVCACQHCVVHLSPVFFGIDLSEEERGTNTEMSGLAREGASINSADPLGILQSSKTQRKSWIYRRYLYWLCHTYSEQETSYKMRC